VDKTSEKEANKSVRFSQKTDQKFSQIAKDLGRSKQELFGQMVDYFYESKKDPSDLDDAELKKELFKGINRILSAITKQEKDLLTPILTEVRDHEKNFLSPILTKVGEMNKEIATQVESEEATNSRINAIKHQYLKIFKYYMEKREQYNSVTNAKDIELLKKEVTQDLHRITIL
jgi:hypothetical protein